ncbi:MAG: hypothetical protein LBF56_03670, partial [Holosporales bacterium]|nr:hypothetical protein [Holosporales bacterium]
MVCESDTTIAANAKVSIGGSGTITVASGKKLVISGNLEIAPYVPPPDMTLFIPPNLVDIKAITGRENGIVHISRKSGYEGLRAMVITQDDTGNGTESKRGLVLERYARDSTSRKFYRTNATYYYKLKISNIYGNMNNGYYIASSEYNDNTTDSGSGSSSDPYMYRVTNAFTSSLCYLLKSMTDYNPSNWKVWSDVEGEFVSDYPYMYRYGTWYQLGNIPTIIADTYSHCYHIFRNNLTPVSGNVYQGGGTYLYKYDDYVYYMLFPIWDTSICSSDITSRDNGMVYVSTHSSSTHKDKWAMVITQLNITTGSTSIQYEVYSRSNTSSNFTIYNNSYSISIPNSIPIQTIDGTYYVACGYDGLSHRTY